MKTFWAAFALSMLAIGIPVFDLLGKNIDFLSAWLLKEQQIILIILLVLFFVPASISVVMALASSLLPVSFVLVFRAALFAVLAMVAVLGWVHALVTPPAVYIFSVLLGSMFGFVVLFKDRALAIAPYVSACSLIAPVLLLLTLSQHGYFTLSKFVITESTATSQVPVVMLIFDELPTISLLDSDSSINANLFPAFSELAADGSWYVNAKSVADNTTQGVPAIVSGLRPKTSVRLPPTYQNYPKNLFTLLSESHQLSVYEYVTQLCPETLVCAQIYDRFRVRGDLSVLTLVLRDIGVVFLHWLLPAQDAFWLPSVAGRTHDFMDALVPHSSSGSSDSRVSALPAFSESVRRAAEGEKPAFLFLHTMLPHVPWMYLPSGKSYETSPGSAMRKELGIDFSTETWSDHEVLTVQGYQRHLLQLMYVDRYLSRIIETLKEIGIYESSLIVVTADHGMSFRTGARRRLTLDEDVYSEMAGVPLIIKWPDSRLGGVIFEEATTVDIVPTIASELGIFLPYVVDGKVLNRSPIELEGKTIFSENDAYDRKVEIFPSLQAEQDLFRIGKNRLLYGKKVSDLPVYSASSVAFTSQVVESPLSDPEFIPARFSGFQEGLCEGPTDIAVAIGGYIRGLTELYQDNNVCRFNILLPEMAFEEGVNQLDLYRIVENGSGLHHLLSEVRYVASRKK